MITSLIYISRSLLVLPDEAHEIDTMVATAIERNARLEVRGVLLFTERHFVQLLEGPEAAIDELMASIERDARHEKVTIVERIEIEGYRFPDWGLAYWGSANYMDRQVSRILRKTDALTRSQHVSDINLLIRKMAQESRDHPGPIGRPSHR